MEALRVGLSTSYGKHETARVTFAGPSPPRGFCRTSSGFKLQSPLLKYMLGLVPWPRAEDAVQVLPPGGCLQEGRLGTTQALVPDPGEVKISTFPVLDLCLLHPRQVGVNSRTPKSRTETSFQLGLSAGTERLVLFTVSGCRATLEAPVSAHHRPLVQSPGSQRPL